MSDQFDNVPDGADYHRRFYRGKDITSAFDNGTFSARVADGTFRDIFPGDYIIKEVTVPALAKIRKRSYEVKFIIADLDIAMNQGSPRVTAHHTVIVPEKLVFRTYMNPSGTNAVGYAGSYMSKTVMTAFAHGLIGAFGTEHLLKSSFDSSGSASSDPLACTCRLMTLSMVFGQTPPWWGGWSWSGLGKDNCMDGTQLAVFSLHPDTMGKDSESLFGEDYWLSDAGSSTDFPDYDGGVYAQVAIIYGGVCAVAFGATNPCGVRPFALLV